MTNRDYIYIFFIKGKYNKEEKLEIQEIKTTPKTITKEETRPNIQTIDRTPKEKKMKET